MNGGKSPGYGVNIRRRAIRLMQARRPRPGDDWSGWAEELLALVKAEAWTHLDPPMRRLAWLRACEVRSEGILTAVRLAFQTLEAAERAGFNRTILGRLAFTRLTRLHSEIGSPDFARLVRAAARR